MAHALLAHHRQILTERLERLLAGLSGDAAPEALRAEVARRVEKEQERVLGGPAVTDAPADLWATLLTSVHARARGQLDRPDDPPATGQQLLRELLDTVAALDPDEIARG
jgi:hypothetical protein